MQTRIDKEFVSKLGMEEIRWWMFGFFPWPRNQQEVEYYQKLIANMPKTTMVDTILDMHSKVTWL